MLPPGGGAEPKSGGSPLRWVGVGALGGGVALSAVSVVMIIRMVGAGKAFDEGVAPYVAADGVPEIPTDEAFEGEHDLCSDGPDPLTDSAAADLETAGVFDACKKLKSSRTIAFVTGGLGVALLGAGAVLLVVGGGKGDAADGAIVLAPGVRLGLDVSPRVAAARLALTF